MIDRWRTVPALAALEIQPVVFGTVQFEGEAVGVVDRQATGELLVVLTDQGEGSVGDLEASLEFAGLALFIARAPGERAIVLQV